MYKQQDYCVNYAYNITTPSRFFCVCGFFLFLIWSPREIRWQSSGCILSCVKRSIKKIKKEKKLHKNLYTFYLNLQGKYINKQSLGLVYGQLLGGPLFVCDRES